MGLVKGTPLNYLHARCGRSFLVGYSARIPRPLRSILKGFLAKGFLTAVANLSDGLVSATLEVYGKVEREMLPTPSRPHYTFNLRDISKVVQVSGSRFSVPIVWI